MDIKELQNEFNRLDFEYKQLEERRKKLMGQLMAPVHPITVIF